MGPEDHLEIELSSDNIDFLIDDGDSDVKTFDCKELSEDSKSKEKEERPEKRSSRRNEDKNNVNTKIEKIKVPEDNLEIEISSDNSDFLIIDDGDGDSDDNPPINMRTLAEYNE